MEEEDYYLSGGEEYLSSDDNSIYGLEQDDDDVSHQRTISKPKIITRESLLAAQKGNLQKVMELLSVREHHARTLLIRYQWDVDQLIAVYVDKGKTRLFADACLTVVDFVDLDPLDPSSTVPCIICMDDKPEKDMTRMDCGHSFCNACWTGHFIVKINDGQSKRIRCMALKCNAICDEAVVKRLVSKQQPDLADKFDRFLLESYIEDNKMVKWCASTPHCGNAIRVESDECCEVECSCGFQFCFNCVSEAHSPCSCLMWELWSKKCRDESETVNWISGNTKPCPKCHKPVEKNGGCNLVSCICGQAFCWLCGGATGRSHTWTTIAGHSCGRYKEDTEKKAASAKRDLYRYMHYHNRYKAHTESFKQETGLRETIKQKVAILEEKDDGLRDFSWVTNGLQRLFRSRRALSYSYPFAFYMFGEELFKDEMTKKEREIKQNLFEDQQQQLESNVEKLSKVLEDPFNEYSDKVLLDTRMQVINLAALIDGLCRKMYDCIENDLLGSLQSGIHDIAPYLSKGIEKAEELRFECSSNSNGNTQSQEAADHSKGEGMKLGKASSYGTSDGSQQVSRKRGRKERTNLSHIDLNLPAQS